MNKQWHIGDLVTKAEIQDAADWCNTRGDVYPQQNYYDPSTGDETWILTAIPSLPTRN